MQALKNPFDAVFVVVVAAVVVVIVAVVVPKLCQSWPRIDYKTKRWNK